ncbi:MAG TPA: UDP-N-acetylmuramate:L-alanyl-gamma-D-glutamyl-meso-diaminopimelate ligase, partial [Gammaproteobacteria bacterium]|nr:UDP-N-acetylmuramate:L-alanyl-gamma-D-glutamyl-meso-diaminopimelate ligase [Gammaproteobacteria bacterium]
MRVHILGVCGTFMGGIAALAKSLGHEVAGSDAGVYPPMSTQLEALGLKLYEGYKPEHLEPAPDMVVVGNALSRGNPAVEAMLARGLPYQSGPQWLYENLLKDRHVIAVAGTHGKTTTSSMTAWILEQAGLQPGFLIGGVAPDFGVSARLGEGRYFVVEADEYDTAFFDKGSKFLHYRPRTAVLNNLEYDHADIFPDLASIENQFHYLVRSIPGNGLIVVNGGDRNLARVLERGCWTPRQTFGAAGGDWQATEMAADGSRFKVLQGGKPVAEVRWKLLGRHNV